METVIFSLFRNREHFVPKFIRQCNALSKKIDLHVVCIENNSTDRTRDLLENWGFKNKHIVGKETDKPLMGSVVSEERFQILADAANIGLDYIEKNLDPDYLMFVESDLVWKPNTILELQELVKENNALVAPMIYTEKDRIFYDILAFQNSLGKNLKPLHQSYYEEHFTGLQEMNSVGSCFVAPGWFTKYRLTEKAIMGFCEQAKNNGEALYASINHKVFHPQ